MGDAALVDTTDGLHILIDGGPAGTVLTSYLHAAVVSAFDYVAGLGATLGD